MLARIEELKFNLFELTLLEEEETREQEQRVEAGSSAVQFTTNSAVVDQPTDGSLVEQPAADVITTAKSEIESTNQDNMTLNPVVEVDPHTPSDNVSLQQGDQTQNSNAPGQLAVIQSPPVVVAQDENINTGRVKPKIISSVVGNYIKNCAKKENLKDRIVSRFKVRNGPYAKFPGVKTGSGNTIQEGTGALTGRKINNNNQDVKLDNNELNFTGRSALFDMLKEIRQSISVLKSQVIKLEGNTSGDSGTATVESQGQRSSQPTESTQTKLQAVTAAAVASAVELATVAATQSTTPTQSVTSAQPAVSQAVNQSTPASVSTAQVLAQAQGSGRSQVNSGSTNSACNNDNNMSHARQNVNVLGGNDVNDNSMIQKMTEQIRYELMARNDDIKRDYRLTPDSNLGHFLYALESDLRARGLLHIIDSNIKPSIPFSDVAINDMKFKVLDILMNRIDKSYYSKVIHIKDPVDLLDKLKSIKSSEVNLTSLSIRKQLYVLRFNPGRETASQFLDKFESLIRSCDNAEGSTPVTETEKRDMFYSAILPVVPNLPVTNFAVKTSKGKVMDYDDLKTFLLQAEAEGQLKVTKPTQAFATWTTPVLEPNNRMAGIKCHSCDNFGHMAKVCPYEDGERRCYNCGLTTNKHEGRSCPNATVAFEHQDRYVYVDSKKENRKRKIYNQGGLVEVKRTKFAENNSHKGDKRGSYSGRGKGRGNGRGHGRGGGASGRGFRGRGRGRGFRGKQRDSQGGNTTSKPPGKTYFVSCAEKLNKNHFGNYDSPFRDKIINFVADSGATEHMVNSKLYFTSFDDSKQGVIKCANKDSDADIKTEGVGTIDVLETGRNKAFILDRVTCANDLSENLLSLRRFADLGLSIYLNDRKIDIVDPNSNEILFSGIYEKPYWLVEFELNKPSGCNTGCRDEIPRANLTSSDNSATHRYNTRSVTANKNLAPDVITENTSNTEIQDAIENVREVGSQGTEITTKVSITDENPEMNVDTGSPYQDKSDFDSSVCNRLIHLVDSRENGLNVNDDFDDYYRVNGKVSEQLMWHIRLGCMSLKYLRQLQKYFPENHRLNKIKFTEEIKDCGLCKIAKFSKLPFKTIRERANKPLQVIHSDLMGVINPHSFPRGLKFIVTCMDDYSRVAMAYCVKSKSETGECIDNFVKSARNLLGEDAKVCYLRTDKGTEFTGGDTIEVLRKLGAELQVTCPDTPEHNGMAERLNQTLSKKVRAYMFDSKLPENMWDLAVGAAVYTYNRTPHRGIEMEIPLMRFKPGIKIDMNQFMRFGCVTYMKIQRKVGFKFRPEGRRVFLVGYKPTGYVLLQPEEGKFYESRHTRFKEKVVYGDLFSKDNIKGWDAPIDKVDKSKWFIEFEEEDDENDKTQQELSKTEGVPSRKRGRPKKIVRNSVSEPPNKLPKAINDTSFSDIPVAVAHHAAIIFSQDENDPSVDHEIKDEVYHALLAKLYKDPTTFAEAVRSRDRDLWLKAIDEELDSMRKNRVWKIVDRPKIARDGSSPNIIDSRWVLKRKVLPDGQIKFKARLVIRGFKDKNCYELSEIYAPVSRLPLVRSIIAIVNYFDLEMCQLDVKTAFLNGKLNEEIYMELPDGVAKSEAEKRDKVAELERALYGLKISPKRWNETFSEAMRKHGLISSDLEPCLYIWREGDKFLIVLLYVDDILMVCNDIEKLKEFKSFLLAEFEMTDLGEPKVFLGINIKRNRETRTVELSQVDYINKMLKRFGFSEMKPVSTPMVTNQVLNRDRKMREDDVCTLSVASNKNRLSFPYREAVGSISYLANATRPDIMYVDTNQIQLNLTGR